MPQQKTVRYQFSQGINGIAERRLVPPGQCLMADNVDLRNGSMRPMRIPRLVKPYDSSDPTSPPKDTVDIYEYRGRWYYSSNHRSYAAEMVGSQERIYVTELGSSHGIPKKYINGTAAFLGTMRPTKKPMVEQGEPVYPPMITVEFVPDAGSLTEGSYTYRVAFNTDYGLQPASVPITGTVPKGQAGGFRIKWTESTLANRYIVYGRDATAMGKLADCFGTTFLDNGAYSPSEAANERNFKTVQYITTWLRKFRGHVNESGPSQLSDGVSTSNVRVIKRPDFVQLKDATSHGVLDESGSLSDENYDWYWRIYRTGDVPGWLLVKELPAATTSYKDFMSPEFLGAAPESIYVENDQDVVFDIPPSDLTGIIIHYNMLFGISGNSIRWTPIGEPDAWPVTFQISFPHAPVALASYAGYLVVLCLDRPYIINGFSPTSLTRMGTLVEDGCIAPYSVQIINNRLYYLARRGIMEFDGTSAQCITEGRISPGYFLAPSKLATNIKSWIIPTEASYNYSALIGSNNVWIGAGLPSSNPAGYNARTNSIEGPIYNIKSFVYGGKYFLYWSNFA